MTVIAEPLGEQDVSRYLCVAPSTVRVWRTRGVLPDPDAILNGNVPVWSRRTIKRWAENTGRLSATLRREVVQSLRAVDDTVDIGQLIFELTGDKPSDQETMFRQFGTVMADLESEGLVVQGPTGHFRAVPVMDAETFEDRCLWAIRRIRSRPQTGAWVSDIEVADELELPESDRDRVASALRRMCSAGLIYPALQDLPPFPSREGEGLFYDLTPAGLEQIGLRAQTAVGFGIGGLERAALAEIRKILETHLQNVPVRPNEFDGLAAFLNRYRQEPWEQDPDLKPEPVGQTSEDGRQTMQMVLRPLAAYTVRADGTEETLNAIRDVLLTLIPKMKFWEKWH